MDTVVYHLQKHKLGPSLEQSYIACLKGRNGGKLNESVVEIERWFQWLKEESGQAIVAQRGKPVMGEAVENAGSKTGEDCVHITAGGHIARRQSLARPVEALDVIDRLGKDKVSSHHQPIYGEEPMFSIPSLSRLPNKRHQHCLLAQLQLSCKHFARSR